MRMNGVFGFSKIDGRQMQNARLCRLTPRFSACFLSVIPRSPLCPAASFTNKFSFHHGEPPHSSPLATTAQPTPFHPWLTAGVLLTGSILIYPGHRFLCRIRDLHQSDQMCIIRNKPQQTSLFWKKVDE